MLPLVRKICGPTGWDSCTESKSGWKTTSLSGGGEMIETVTFKKTTYAGLPHKFEGGTPIYGGIAFGVAIDYINSIGLDRIFNYEQALL